MIDTAVSQTTLAGMPERWARALDRALHAGVELYTTPTGERFASSGSCLDLIYRVTETTCKCTAAMARDPVCSHRAALRSVLETLPVLVLPVDDLGGVVRISDARSSRSSEGQCRCCPSPLTVEDPHGDAQNRAQARS